MSAAGRFEIRSAAGTSSAIILEAGLRTRLGTCLASLGARACVLLLDRGLPSEHRASVRAGLPGGVPVIEVPGGEAAKSIESVQSVWEDLLRLGVDRETTVVTCGGGAVSDLGGFIAGTWMRGVPVVHIPTTLLAQVDAAIGGKSAVNLGPVKNPIGVFHHPRAVLLDPGFLATVPEREFRAGLAEVIKYALIRDPEILTMLPGLTRTDLPRLADLVLRSARIKGEIVAADPTDQGQRNILNAGHTVGHALESVSHAQLPVLLHGEAVAIGLAAETSISLRLGLMSAEEHRVVIGALVAAGLPVAVPAPWSAAAVLRFLRHDKKIAAGVVRWPLVVGIGSCQPGGEVPDGIVREALGHVGCHG